MENGSQILNKAHPQNSSIKWTAIGTTLLLIAALTAFLSNFAPPRENLPLFLTLFAASSAALTALIWRNFAFFQSASISRRHWLCFLMVSATILRLGTLAAPVSLSDDIHRYVWDGNLLQNGHNPYASTPANLTTNFTNKTNNFHTTKELQKLNSPDYHTVYPPLAQITFATGTAIAKITPLPAERAIRLLFLLADLLTILLLAKTLEKLGKNRVTALFYAWNPFIFWEFIAGGHSEALLLPCLLLVIHAVISDKTATKIGLFLGLAALLKPTVLVISPVLAFYLLRKHSLFTAATTAVVSAATVATGYALLWHPDLLANHRASFALYADTFSFNAPIFYTLQHFWGYQEGITPPVQHLIAPWLNLATIAAITLAAITQNGRPTRLATGFTIALAAHLFLSPVFHPWYLAPVLLCALLTRPQIYLPFILLSLLVPLSYFFYDPNLSQNTKILLMALQFIPPSLLLAFSPAKTAFNKAIHSILKSRAHTKFQAIAPHLNPGDTLLDIGAGEGFVGLHAAEQGHPTHLVDLSTQSNRTNLPMTSYNGRDLPFADAQFDVAILSYVLHHCHDPDQVLREAARTCRRLIILETVYITEFDRRRTTFLDHNANRLRGIPKEPLHFDTPEGWQKRFQNMDLNIQHFQWLGQGIHKHVIFVLDPQ